MKIPDPNQPFTTCSAEDCDDCIVNRKLHCNSSPMDLPRLLLIICPSLVLGGAGVCNISAQMLIPWLVLLVGCFGFAAVQGLGSSCLPGAGQKRALTSLPGLGALKTWNDRYVPMSSHHKVWFFSGVGLTWGYPIWFLIYGDQFFLLMTYLLSTTSFWVSLKSFLCSRCINFACPMNSVDDYIRSDFFESNPGVTKLWNRKNRPLNFFWRRMKTNRL